MIEFIVKYWLQWLFGIVVAGFTMMYRNLAKRLKEEQRKRKALEQGMVALLRNSIVDSYNHCIERGFCPIYVRDNIQRMYKAYNGLVVDGVITDIVNDLSKMPTQ